MDITKRLTWAGGSILFAALLFVSPTILSADGCYLCASGSSCQQCRYGSSDTFAARKACESKGCKVSGTTSCSSAANVKVCVRPKAKKYFWSRYLELPIWAVRA